MTSALPARDEFMSVERAARSAISDHDVISSVTTRASPRRPSAGEGVGEEGGARSREGRVRRGEQIGLRVHPTELARFQETVEERGDLGAALGARAVVILAADDHASERAFGGVVVQGNPRIAEEAREPRPQAQRVRDGLAETALGQRPLLKGPRADGVDDGDRLLPPRGGPELQRLRPSVLARAGLETGDRSFHGVELPDQLEHLPTGLRIVRLRLHELAADVGPAIGQGEPRSGPRQASYAP